MVRREWRVLQPDKEAIANLRKAGYPRVTATLLALRGLKDPEEAKSFLSGDGKFHDPMLLADVEKAAARILKAIEGHEKITVYGDYDADGVTSAALLYSYLKENGADVDYYIPDRESEGYGLNSAACKRIADSGTTLIITVDTGISAFDEAKLLNELGVCLIITDHHNPYDTLPEAYAIVNPKRQDCKYPFKELAGVGTAFKLVCAIEKSKPEGLSEDALFKKYGELVCVGTVADVVPLLGENRLIVCRGLKLISEGKNIGISALLEAAGVRRRLTSTLLGFTVAPRINACGRIATAGDAFELLTTRDTDKAKQLAQKLNDNNSERRRIEAEILKETVKNIDENESLRLSPLLIVSGEKWHNGVIGIVASRLVELYGKPAIVVSFDGDIGRASCRSVPGFNIHAALKSCSQYLERFGGHELAAGFTVKRENYDALYAALNHLASIQPELPTLRVCMDMKLHGYEISLSTAREVRRLEPFGSGNPAPLFYVPAAQITALSPVGDGHTRISFNCDGFEFTAVMFNTARRGFDFKVWDIVDLAVSLEVSLYKNTESLGVIVRDIRKSACFEYYTELYKSFLSGTPIASDALRARLKPDREEFAAVFRLLTRREGKISLEKACKDICRVKPRFNYFKLLLIKDIFTETGLIVSDGQDDGENITYRLRSGVKIDLAASALLKRL